MITEDYVSFEIAKLLKEKGFGDGRNSMEEDIMKDVVEIPLHQWLPSLLYDKMSEKGFKDGDMVKLIIIKED